MQFGLNLYSIRNRIQTEEDMRKTFERLKQDGFSYVQFSGVPMCLDTAEKLKRVSEEFSMPVVLTHSPMDRILQDTENLMKEHELFGCKNIGLGAMPTDCYKDKNLLYKTINDLNEVGKVMKDNGFNFFYHHHHYEFMKFDDKTVFDFVLEKAPYINFTLDTYWVQYGGANILETIKKAKGRIGCVHLKDYKIFEDYNPNFAPLGDGTMNFKKIIPALKKAKVKYFLIEQDNAADLPDGMEQVEKSAKYLIENF